MGSARTLFAFGCSFDVCHTLNEWLFLSGISLQEYQSAKRVLADVSRQNPEVILINVDTEKGIQLLDALRAEEQTPLLVGISSGVDRGRLFSSMFSHSLADYYAQRPIERGFLDELLARSLGDVSIVQERTKVDIKELSEMVSQRDVLKEENRGLQHKLDELIPDRDRLQLQLAELLTASSKYGAEIERLELEYERNQQDQESLYEERLALEKSKQQNKRIGTSK